MRPMPLQACESMHDLNPLADALASLFLSAHSLFFMIVLYGIRVMVVFQVLPATMGPVIPGMVRSGIVCLLTVFVAVGQDPRQFDTYGDAQLLLVACKEAFIGLVIGYMASAFFWIAQSVGTLIDDLSGFNFIQMSNPQQGQQNTPVGLLLLQLTVTLFYVSGGFIVLLDVLFHSYRWWPLTTIVPDLHVAASDLLIHEGDNILGSTAKMCAPVILALVLVDVGLGVISRAAGKLEPTSLGQPIKGVLALLVLIAITATVASQVRELLDLSRLGSTLSGLISHSPTR
jgi:type III secretion protein T